MIKSPYCVQGRLLLQRLCVAEVIDALSMLPRILASLNGGESSLADIRQKRVFDQQGQLPMQRDAVGFPA